MTFLFASRRRWRGSEQWLLNKLVTEFGAVEVTGTSLGWERERVLVEAGWYGELAEGGDQPGEPDSDLRTIVAPPAASSAVQDPLFREEAA